VMKNDFWEYHPEDSTTGILELNDKNSMLVAPNPMQTETSISFREELLLWKLSLQISDASGKIVRSVDVYENPIVLDKGSMRAGTYLIRLIQENNVKATTPLIIVD